MQLFLRCFNLKVWKGMEAFLYTEGIQLSAANSGGRCSDLTQEEVQHLWVKKQRTGHISEAISPTDFNDPSADERSKSNFPPKW